MRNKLCKIDLRGLNPKQREAVCQIEGALLVLAGAGTGKTRVVTSRIAYLIAEGIEPGSILAVTFTNKAAREMKERISDMVPGELATQVTACTFHSFGVRILRQYIGRLGYSSRFDIANESYADGLIKALMSELSLNKEGQLSSKQWRYLISSAKSNLLEPEDIDQSGNSWPSAFSVIYQRYRNRMKALNMLDFDDLLGAVVKLWREHPTILEKCRKKYRYLLVDEYQDTNHAQFILTSMLAGSTANLCVVGDDDQSIYGWRGAAVGHILEFKDRYPNASVVRLEQNYRSTNRILQAANQVIANNPARHDKELWSKQGEGEKIMVIKARNETDEAECIAELIRDRRAGRGGGLGDFAVLYRSNHLSRSLEKIFRKKEIDYCLVGSKSFYQNKEILDVISMLRLARNPRDDQSLLRILNTPPRGIGDKSVERLQELQRIVGRPLSELLVSSDYLAELSASAAEEVRKFDKCLRDYREQFGRPGELARKIRGYLNDSGYLTGLGRIYKPRADALKRYENVLEFINGAAELEENTGNAVSLDSFLESFALRDDNDRLQGKPGNSVNLMTVHAAKGLEFPVVFVIGMEKDLFPHRNSLGQPGGMDEERRLFYVAATRAQEELIVTHADSRRINGYKNRRQPSRFLMELPVSHTLETDSRKALQPASPEVAADFLARMKAQFMLD